MKASLRQADRLIRALKGATGPAPFDMVLAMSGELGRYAKGDFHFFHYPPYRHLFEQLRPGQRVLDVGCGSGELGAFLSTSGARVEGVEPDAERAAQAAERLSAVTVGTIETADLAGHFDFVLFLDVLEHVAEPAPTLARARALLAEGGRILALVPNSAFWRFRLKIARGDWSYADSGLFDRGHLRFYDTRTIGEVAARSGLTEVDRRYFPENWNPSPLLSKATERFPNLLAMHAFVEWAKA